MCRKKTHSIHHATGFWSIWTLRPHLTVAYCQRLFIRFFRSTMRFLLKKNDLFYSRHVIWNTSIQTRMYIPGLVASDSVQSSPPLDLCMKLRYQQRRLLGGFRHMYRRTMFDPRSKRWEASLYRLGDRPSDGKLVPLLTSAGAALSTEGQVSWPAFARDVHTAMGVVAPEFAF